MKVLRTISRITIGLVFLFSGFVKVVDPMGFKFKFDDYFAAFGMEWFIPFALFFGIVLSIMEFATGFALIANLFTRFFSWITLLFMSFFTILTFILALTNPVSDCGCFGDAIVLTNWQTFFKNLIFIVPTIILFVNRIKYSSRCNKAGSFLQFIFIIGVALYIALHSLFTLPLIDFRAYRVGQNIVLNSKEHLLGAPQAIFETCLIYEKNGEHKSFDLNNLPDSTWKWVETINSQIAEGYIPPAKDLNLSDIHGNDYTTPLFQNQEPVLMSLVLDMESLSDSQLENYNQIAVQCLSNNIYFALLTSTSPDVIEQIQARFQPTYKILNADPIVLKTMIRSDGGFIFTYKGTILKKWGANDFPDVMTLNEYTMIKSAATTGNAKPLQAVMWYMLLFLSVALFFDWIALSLRSRI
ncbi:MAG: DoxX family protein [Salinivirgaceae bacterium]|nr:DoxX family protein [Salinivirgaceae bacterium]